MNTACTHSVHPHSGSTVPTRTVHTLIIGSGAAGLAAALELYRCGITDILIATESLRGGTSINTGSDKQTYYKLSLCGAESDSVRAMAETYFSGGSMHGDLALAEAANSVRAFMNLVQLGLPFPADEYGQFVGYKTDHDPRQRATSIGPYTSREMCRAMIREVQKKNIPVMEQLFVKELLVAYDAVPENDGTPVTGAVYGAIFYAENENENVKNSSGNLLKIEAQNVIFAVGGPGGLYKTSVYPTVHTGAIGVALAAGAVAQNLPESQFGMASVGFRWNVSGTYMQCVPRFVSTDSDGISDEREFLEEYASTPGALLPLVFLKGYQWPFDARKTQLAGGGWGSSMVDVWVYTETVLRGRRVWLDFTRNPLGFSLETIGPEARKYLENSGADALPTPLARLEKMNPDAVTMYAEHGIEIRREKLEIAVCAQHNNGGLAADVNWESLNIRGLFPIGEVNGSHGVYRPGGSALNAGQVGALRAVRTIAERKNASDRILLAGSEADFSSENAVNFSENRVNFPENAVNSSESRETYSENAAKYSENMVKTPENTTETEFSGNVPPISDWRSAREELQQRMTRAGGFIRQKKGLEKALFDAHRQAETLIVSDMQSHRNAYLLLTQELYLDAIRFQLESGVGSRGSAIVLTDENPEQDTEKGSEKYTETGTGTEKAVAAAFGAETLKIRLDGSEKSLIPENTRFRNFVLESWRNPDGRMHHRWVPCREIPNPDSWFENVWRKNRK